MFYIYKNKRNYLVYFLLLFLFLNGCDKDNSINYIDIRTNKEKYICNQYEYNKNIKLSFNDDLRTIEMIYEKGKIIIECIKLSDKKYIIEIKYIGEGSDENYFITTPLLRKDSLYVDPSNLKIIYKNKNNIVYRDEIWRGVQYYDYGILVFYELDIDEEAINKLKTLDNLDIEIIIESIYKEECKKR